jgi:hypothetical protein
VRKITAAGVVSTVAGSTLCSGPRRCDRGGDRRSRIAG